MSKAISRRDFLKVTGAVGAAGLLAACGGSSNSTAASTASSAAEAASVAGLSSDPVTLTMSWWGGESRHNAYQEALKAFSAANSNITVNPTFAAWSGWEDTMSTKFAGGVAEDVCQINWNWLYNYSANGQTFIDLNSVTDYLDLSQWDDAKLAACNVANAQQCVPVAMTGRIFYWNMTTFNKAGITEVPKTLDDLMNAGKAFQEKLGDDYYPLALGEYDRMILMTFYLESVYGKPWVENGELQYTAEEVATGLDFIESLEDNHVIPSIPTMNGKGIDANNSIDKSQVWIDGTYAGIFEWDSSANKYQSALADNSGFVVGDEIKFGDKANGGFSKVSMGLAITETCQHPAEAAALINFLLNEEAGASIMGSECGIPNSAAGLSIAEAADKVKPLVKEANSKVMAFVDFPLDPTYESTDLKANPGGTYADVFGGLSYDEYDSTAEAAEDLVDGIEDALASAAQ